MSRRNIDNTCLLICWFLIILHWAYSCTSNYTIPRESHETCYTTNSFIFLPSGLPWFFFLYLHCTFSLSRWIIHLWRIFSMSSSDFIAVFILDIKLIIHLTIHLIRLNLRQFSISSVKMTSLSFNLEHCFYYSDSL